MKKALSAFKKRVKQELVHRQILDAPLPSLMIETTDHCNLKCPFCSNKDISRRKFEMTRELFEKVVNEYAELGGKLVRIYSTGEPLMCKNFFPFIEYCNQKGLKIRFTTNGLLLNEEKIANLLNLNIDSINFSVEGVNKQGYEKIRIGGKFETILGVLSLFKQMRDRKNLTKPSIRIQTALNENEQNQDYIEAFSKLWLPYCDSIYFSPVGSQGGTNQDFKNKIPMEDRERCDFFWTLLTVNNDGTVSCCCVDYNRSKIVGNLNKETLTQIWNGEKLKKWRKSAFHLRYEDISSDCARCTSISRTARLQTEALAAMNRKSITATDSFVLQN